MYNTFSENIKGWVLYDGKCGFCSWWIPFWEKTINKAGFGIAMLQEKWVINKLQHDNEVENKDIILLFNDGSKLIGADAYIYGMKTIWWSKPFGLIFSIPPFRHITWLFYRFFNRNRFFVSKLCRLEPKIRAN